MSGTIDDDLGRLRSFPDVSVNYVPPSEPVPTITVTVRDHDLPKRSVHPIFGTPCVVSDTITVEWVERHELVLRRDEVGRWESEGGG